MSFCDFVLWCASSIVPPVIRRLEHTNRANPSLFLAVKYSVHNLGEASEHSLPVFVVEIRLRRFRDNPALVIRHALVERQPLVEPRHQYRHGRRELTRSGNPAARIAAFVDNAGRVLRKHGSYRSGITHRVRRIGVRPLTDQPLARLKSLAG